MIRLIESPPGHLSGTLVISSLDEKGTSRKDDAVRDLAGTINGPNVSLQVQGAALASFFGIPTNLIGELHGNTLSLSLGNNTEIFRKTSNKQYAKAIAGLNEVAQHAALSANAQKLLQEVASDDRRIDADLTQYISWGQQRISHVPTLQQWYAQRLAGYSKCLKTIQPLAMEHVPSWRWQSCALYVQNDKYSRDQMSEAVRSLRSQNDGATIKLGARISASREKFSEAVTANKSACAYAKYPEKCAEDVIKLNSYAPEGPIDGNLLSTYYATIPRVNEAISTDLQTSEQGEASLAALAQKINDVYRTAK